MFANLKFLIGDLIRFLRLDFLCAHSIQVLLILLLLRLRLLLLILPLLLLS